MIKIMNNLFRSSVKLGNFYEKHEQFKYNLTQ
jgi:hypothetical protein